MFLRGSTFRMKYFNAPRPTMRAISSASSGVISSTLPSSCEVSLAVDTISSIRSSASTTVPSRLSSYLPAVPPFRKKMYKAFTPFKTQFIQQDGQYLEMVVLFVSYHINHFIDRIVSETQFGSSDILCHVDGSSVGTEQQFLVQAVFGQVCPYGTVFFFVENAFSRPSSTLPFPSR